MPSEDQNRADFMKTINRCAEAYHHVKAQLPKATFSWSMEAQDNQRHAFQAFTAQLPILYDLESFQLYIACIAQGVAIGAIDVVDAGRFCHIAQTAMSVWKLVNLTIPAAQKKQKQDPLPPTKGNQPTANEARNAADQPSEDHQNPSEPPQNPDPLPSKGNHLDIEEIRAAAAPSPASDTQPEPHQSLNEPYIPGSGMQRLRHEAWLKVQALKQAGYPLDQVSARKAQPGPEPAHEAPPEPAQTL